MRVAILGYGKMGKAIEPILIERGHEIVLKVNSQNPLQSSDLNGVDVAIEVSRPDLAMFHIEQCLSAKVPTFGCHQTKGGKRKFTFALCHQFFHWRSHGICLESNLGQMDESISWLYTEH
jgi:hypothetical protein